jgi:hypothetical protein
MALGGVRGQHLRHLAGVRRVRRDRDPGAARSPDRRLFAGHGGPRGGRGGGGAARALGGVPAQAVGHGGDGPGPMCGGAQRARGVRLRSVELRPAPARLRGRGGGRHRVQGGERGVSQGRRRARGPARRQRAVRVHDLDGDRVGAAARRGGDRALRAGGDGAGRRRQLPALGLRDPRDGRTRTTSGASARVGSARSRAARRVALHLRAPGVAPVVRQQVAGQRLDHGDGTVDGRAHARPPRVHAVAVRAGVRGALRRWAGRRAAVASARRSVRAASGPHRGGHPAGLLIVGPRARPSRRRRARARDGRPVRPGDVHGGVSTRCSPPSGSTTSRPIASHGCWPPGRSARTPRSPR